ncbi:MAG: S8 family serine peptidase, partial [Micromonosporaceae bacterium]
SGGDRKGVAPGARLLVGKVLGDDGTGSLSMVLDGMEWAAASGADVVNLSLGAGPTDGTDPLSLALNRLTEETGTLFVASAGNDGPDEFTIGSPGAADAALTVGAVDRDETLASFSSRGPRLDDLALKPDITAPGVGIVAARASGTSMGTPVDEHYTAASGTSMAAPHVAGAAAILAGQHPDWAPDQLKDALVSTAERHPDYSPYAQGGGRVDVSRASQQGAYATGSLGFGSLSGGESASKDVRYTNHSDAAVTLTLDVTGDAAAIDVPTSVEVPAGGAATVAVTVDAAELPAGRYGGYLTAASADGEVSLHTTLGAVKEAPRRTVTLTGVNRAGEPAFVNPVLLLGTDRRYDVRTYIPAGSTRTVEVPEGDYFLHGVIKDRVSDGRVASLVVDPELEIDKDMSLVLDARKANQVEIKTPRPAVQEGIFSFYTHRAFADRRIGNGHMEYASSRRLYVTPTPDTREGTFEFASRWQLTAPMISVRALTNGDEFDLDPRYLNRSPALDGTHKLPVVDVGDGRPEDYQRLADDGVDLSGTAALVNGRSNNDDAAVKAAAAAGASAVIVAAPANSVVLTSWNPKGDRLPATAVVITREEANRLRDSLAGASVTVELRGTPASPYLYDVMQVSKQRVPERVLHHVTSANTATVMTRYTDNGGFPYTKEQRFGWRPWQDEAINQFQRHVPTAHEREEYVSANDTWWRHEVHHRSTWDNSAPVRGGMTGPIQRYAPGQRSNETWYAPVARPAIPRGVEGLTSYRSGDVLTIRIPEVADGQPGHYSRADRGDWGGVPADTVTGKLYRDGDLIAEAKHAWGDFPAGGESGRYRLDLSVVRETPEWRCSVRTDTSWSFESQKPGAGEKPLLPLLQLDYAVPVDLHGVAGDERAANLDITARHQAGLGGLAVAGMEVSASYDDGERWHDAALTDQGDGQFRVRLEHPAASQGSGFVSLRVRAWDTDGNSVTQTVLRAYALG